MDGIQRVRKARARIEAQRKYMTNDEIKQKGKCELCKKKRRLAIVAWMVNVRHFNPVFCFSCFDACSPVMRSGPIICYLCLTVIAHDDRDECHLFTQDDHEADVVLYSHKTQLATYGDEHMEKCNSC